MDTETHNSLGQILDRLRRVLSRFEEGFADLAAADTDLDADTAGENLAAAVTSLEEAADALGLPELSEEDSTDAPLFDRADVEGGGGGDLRMSRGRRPAPPSALDAMRALGGLT